LNDRARALRFCDALEVQPENKESREPRRDMRNAPLKTDQNFKPLKTISPRNVDARREGFTEMIDLFRSSQIGMIQPGFSQPGCTQ
jgi:hypothetical protein